MQTKAVQYLVRRSHCGSAAPMLIWTLVGSTIASEVRVKEPLDFLATIPGVRSPERTGLQYDELKQTWPGEEKVFIQQRVIIPLHDHLNLQRQLIANGYLIVAELDDDPWHFAELVNTNFLALKGCHCVQTTTEVMAETIREFNPHVAVFPNQIASPTTKAVGADRRLFISPADALFRRLNREADWAPDIQALNNVLSRHGSRVRVQAVYDRAFYGLATPYKFFEPLCPYDRYHELLGEADIAFLPLAPTDLTSTSQTSNSLNVPHTK